MNNLITPLNEWMNEWNFINTSVYWAKDISIPVFFFTEDHLNPTLLILLNLIEAVIPMWLFQIKSRHVIWLFMSLCGTRLLNLKQTITQTALNAVLLFVQAPLNWVAFHQRVKDRENSVCKHSQLLLHLSVFFYFG